MTQEQVEALHSSPVWLEYCQRSQYEAARRGAALRKPLAETVREVHRDVVAGAKKQDDES